jgi:hypothetical protein
MLIIDPRDLAAAVERDTLAVKGEAGNGNTLACRRTPDTSAQLAALAQKVTLATVEPIKTGVTKAFGQPT